MATARLRKTFHYPAEYDSDGDPAEGIDEEEQEKVIESLHRCDEDQTGFYLTAFLALPLLCTLPYLPLLLRPASAASFLAALLAITSLLATAYILAFVPLSAALFPFLPSGGGSWGATGFTRDRRDAPQPRQLVGGMELRRPAFIGEEGGPVERYVAVLAGALNAVMALRGWAEVRRGAATWGREGIWAVLPGVVWVVVLAARTQLRPVDVTGLEELRYRYKGA